MICHFWRSVVEGFFDPFFGLKNYVHSSNSTLTPLKSEDEVNSRIKGRRNICMQGLRNNTEHETNLIWRTNRKEPLHKHRVKI